MNPEWWRYTTIYHIYPRSFQDSNNDGVGDIQGIINRLDYLKDLGIETLWISPFFSSPGMDHGYDISDYNSIDPFLGNMRQVDVLIHETHKRDMKIVLDLVMNHTSNQHEWFRESRSSLSNPKRDWYIWKPGKKDRGRKAPNNWRSMIGTKGWNYDSATDEWYYSSFLSFQPDLNWINPEVQNAMFDVVRFWLEKGVDGFRLDIFNCLGKNQEYPDNPFYFRYLPTPDNNDQCFWQDKQNNFNHPYSFVFARELRKVIDEYPGRFLLGEISGKKEILKKFIKKNHDGLNLVFQFELLHFKFKTNFFYKFLKKVEKDFSDPYVPVYVYSNHDVGRGISRLNNNHEKAKILALFQIAGRGVPVIYNGDEIGMGNHNLSIKSANDPLARLYRGVPKWIANIFGILINRDDARTPMIWNSHDGRGFSASGVEPWLPYVTNSANLDIHSQQKNRSSLWHIYASLLKLRRDNHIMVKGEISNVGIEGDKLFFRKSLENQFIEIIINFSLKESIHKFNNDNLSILFATNEKIRNLDNGEILLPPISGVILACNL